MDPLLLVVQLAAVAGVVTFAVVGLRGMRSAVAAGRALASLPRPARRRVARRVRRGELPPAGDEDREAVVRHARSQAAMGTWLSGMLGCLAVSQAALLLLLDEAGSTWVSMLMALATVFGGAVAILLLFWRRRAVHILVSADG